MRPRTALLAILIGASCVLLRPDLAAAGMPSLAPGDVRRVVVLSNLTRARLEAISFFVACLLICAGLIQGAWNALRKDFTILPRLSFAKALGLLFLWGLLFVIVLTMISGARELMTPGAWEKRGLTYRLADNTTSPAERAIRARVDALERLGEALRQYAQRHDRNYPPPDAIGAIPEALWSVPDSDGRRYVYRGGRSPEDESLGQADLLAYEPDVFGPDRLVLLTDGEVTWMPITEIEAADESRRP